MDYSAIANLPNLARGATGSNVITLQNWLVANNFLDKNALANGGAGNYGPLTEAAVAKWQQSDPNLATATAGKGQGAFGPITKSFIASQSSGAKAGGAPAGTQQQTQPTNQFTTVGAVVSHATDAAIIGKPPITFKQAVESIQNDPNALQKYADQTKLDTQSFTQGLQQLQQATTTNQGELKTQFENERKALAEQQAAMGNAYSGFRGKAEKDLAQRESGIVQSTRSQLQQNLNKLTSDFESKYGTEATKAATAPFTNPMTASDVSISGLSTPGSTDKSNLAGQKAGGITGTDITGEAANLQANQPGLTKFPNIA